MQKPFLFCFVSLVFYLIKPHHKKTYGKESLGWTICDSHLYVTVPPSNKKNSSTQHWEVNKSIYKWRKLFPIYYRKYDIKYVQIWYGLYETHWTIKKECLKHIIECWWLSSILHCQLCPPLPSEIDHSFLNHHHLASSRNVKWMRDIVGNEEIHIEGKALKFSNMHGRLITTVNKI